MSFSLDDSVQYLKTVGPQKTTLLNSIGIKTVKDLLFYFPYKYLDRRKIVTSDKLGEYIAAGFDGEVTLIGVVNSKECFYFGKKRMMKVVMKDEKAFFDLVWFRRIEFFQDKFNEGEFFAISGKPVLTKYNHLQFVHPDYDKLDNAEANDFLHTGRIIPVYSVPEKLRKNKMGELSIRKLVHQVVQKYASLLEDPFDQTFLSKFNLNDLTTAIANLHFPKNYDALTRAKYRMKFEELFFFELLLAIRKYKIKNILHGNSFKINAQLIKNFLAQLPFTLTKSQLSVLSEIRKDLESNKPMNRLLQGDVGSGKTIVALICMLIVSSNNMQSVFLVPTEILARQHFKNIQQYLHDLNIDVFILIGGMSNKEKDFLLTKINSKKNCIVVGTHALFEENVELNNLGLVVIDEQHKFGVVQRSKIIKKGKSPDVLIMTATPIPRTLSLTAFGDLDVSIINESPSNRKQIKTFLRSEHDLNNIYEFIKSRVEAEEQAFIVYPVIEDNDNSELKSAEKYFKELSQNVFAKFKIGLLHGRMSTEQKDEIMQNFRLKKLDILVSTTVIEVGIDIPDATIILINDAERFGLAQLHQMRGRIGRSNKQSYCILVTNKNINTKINFDYNFEFLSNQQIQNHKTSIRLAAMEKYSDGFKLAEIDLKLRGPGDILGTKQAGIPEFIFADLTTDSAILDEARKAAFELIESDSHLHDEKNQKIKSVLEKYSTSKASYFKIG
ncbi:MAG: ATP-dependent DNA helicase RecG [Ignavibacteriales bacterium]